MVMRRSIAPGAALIPWGSERERLSEALQVVGREVIESAKVEGDASPLWKGIEQQRRPELLRQIFADTARLFEPKGITRQAKERGIRPDTTFF